MADAPLWLIAVIMLTTFPLAVEAGYRLHRQLTRGSADAQHQVGAGYIVSAALALLGLLIGFTFAMAAERYETRRQLVVDEANAIGTTYLRAQLFDEPERSRLSGSLVQYLKARQAFSNSKGDAVGLAAAHARTTGIQAGLWLDVRQALRTPAGVPLTTSMLQTVNQMFDLASEREAALDARVPADVLNTLVGFVVVTALVMGYALAAGGRRHLMASSGLFVLVAVAILLIIDLDQPRTGNVRVPQAPLDQLAADILKTPAPSPRG